MIYKVPATGSRRAAPSERRTPVFVTESSSRLSLTKADAAYTEIRARILSCDLPPGSLIEQEVLAGWLGTSTTPLREALRRLEAERFVALRAHSDARVAPVSIEEFRELHSVRLGLEPIAAAQAAEIAGEAEIRTLRQLLDHEPAVDGSVQDRLERTRSFHRAIYTASGNRTMTEMLDATWDRISRYRVILARAGSAATCRSPEHALIVDALAERDAERANRLVRVDLDENFQRLLPIAETALLPYR